MCGATGGAAKTSSRQQVVKAEGAEGVATGQGARTLLWVAVGRQAYVALPWLETLW